MGNYKSVLSAVRQISSMPPEGFGISARNITVSTVGVVPGIKNLRLRVFRCVWPCLCTLRAMNCEMSLFQ